MTESRPGSSLLLPLLVLPVTSEHERVVLRQRLRQVAEILGFGQQERTRLSTAISEAVRCLLGPTGHGRAEIVLGSLTYEHWLRIYLKASVEAPRPGEEAQKRLRLELIPLRRLVDQLQLETAPGQPPWLLLGQRLPPSTRKLDGPNLVMLVGKLVQKGPGSALDEVQVQNQDLLRTLDEARRGQEALTRINQALKAYAHTVSHDLKGPLSGASAAGQLLRQLVSMPMSDRVRADIDEVVTLLLRSIDRSVNMINSLLTLAESEQAQAAGTLVDVDRVLEEVLEDRRALIAERKAEVQVQGPLGQVAAAPAHVYQLFANLVDNAIRHHPGLPHVQVIRLAGPGLDSSHFLVRDDGPGIPERMQPVLFEAFSKGEGEGHGIGLATVRRIVESYQGQVRCYNDGGACFEFSLGGTR